MGWPGAYEEWCNHIGVNVLDARRIPLWLVVFIDRQGPDALYGFAAHTRAPQVRREKAVPHQIALHT